MLIVWFFAYKKLAQFAVRGALPPRRSKSPVCATDNKPSCVLHLLGWFIGSRGFSSLERRPEFWILHLLFPRVEYWSLSRFWFFGTPWTVACQAPMSMAFPRQEYWSAIAIPSSGHLSNPGIEPGSPTLQADSLLSEPPGKIYLQTCFSFPTWY